MDSSVLAPLSREQRQMLLTAAPLLTLSAVFATIADPRSKHGQRYDLPDLLLCLTAALRVFLQFDRGHWTRVSRAPFALRAACLGRVGSSAPRHRSIAGFFLASLASSSNGRWLGFVRATLTAAEEDAVALDGKTLRGAASPGQTAPHLLAFWTHGSQETLLQVRESREDERDPCSTSLVAMPRAAWARLYG